MPEVPESVTVLPESDRRAAVVGCITAVVLLALSIAVAVTVWRVIA